MIILSNCTQTVALLGPAMTGAKTGNIYQSGFSYASSNIIKKQFGQSPSEFVQSRLIKINNKDKTSLIANEKSKLIKINNKDKTSLIANEKSKLIKIDNKDKTSLIANEKSRLIKIDNKDEISLIANAKKYSENKKLSFNLKNINTGYENFMSEVKKVLK